MFVWPVNFKYYIYLYMQSYNIRFLLLFWLLSDSHGALVIMIMIMLVTGFEVTYNNNQDNRAL